MDGVKKQDLLPKRVLIVDDEETFRSILRSFVESLGYSCAEAESGHSALALLKKRRFPLVISDIVMPEMDGIELLRMIKKRYSEVDVLIITGHGSDYSPMKIVQAGASDFLAKPFNLEQLGARLHKIEMEKALRNKLYFKTITDELTEVYNRGHFYQKLKRETERAKRQGHPVSIIMLDVDGFKRFNDQHGHLKGDALLRTLARVLEFSVRENVDSVFRYGGDEFVVILPETDEGTALLIGSRIQKNFQDTAPAGQTLSMGAAEFHEGFDVEAFVNLADRRMYEEKLKSKGLVHAELQIGIGKDDHTIRCLNCGHLVHWTSSVCEKCMADPLRKTDSTKGQEIARTFLREVGRSVEDRRNVPRIRIRKSIMHDSLQAITHNVSMGGLQIETDASLSVGKTIKIPLPLKKSSLTLDGIVVYVQSLADARSLVGIQFSEMSLQDSRLLNDFLDSFSAQGL